MTSHMCFALVLRCCPAPPAAAPAAPAAAPAAGRRPAAAAALLRISQRTKDRCYFPSLDGTTPSPALLILAWQQNALCAQLTIIPASFSSLELGNCARCKLENYVRRNVLTCDS